MLNSDELICYDWEHKWRSYELYVLNIDGLLHSNWCVVLSGYAILWCCEVSSFELIKLKGFPIQEQVTRFSFRPLLCTSCELSLFQISSMLRESSILNNKYVEVLSLHTHTQRERERYSVLFQTELGTDS